MSSRRGPSAGRRYSFVDGAAMLEVRIEDFLRDGPKAG
jgi:hypothetical protein